MKASILAAAVLVATAAFASAKPIPDVGPSMPGLAPAPVATVGSAEHQASIVVAGRRTP
jgi:uncharacterized membrane protein